MSTWIKAGFWESLCKNCKGYNGWLNLDNLIKDIASTNSSGVSTVKVSVSSSEILNLFTTPKTLIAAPGLGKVLNVLRVYYKVNFGTVAYSNPSLSVVLGTGVVTPFQIVNGLSNVLNVTTTSFVRPAMTTTVVNADFGYNNQELVLKAAAAPTSGDGTLDVYITYEVITL